MEEETDCGLVIRAKEGDKEAFDQLVRRHRSKVIYWARQLTKDLYLADDIAQDALLRSYMYLESLQHTDRFLPWLKNIVRNKAIDHWRKTHLSEQLLTGSEDYISHDRTNPEVQFLNDETLQSIYLLTASLNEKSRKIFEAHFFQQMQPNEIALIYGMNINNVYNIISRAKFKLRETIYIQETQRYAAQRKAKSAPIRGILPPPNYQSAYVSLGYAIFQTLQYTSLKSLSLCEVMGLSGQAFRIQMTNDAGLSSSLIYDWKSAVNKTGQILGYESICIGEPNCSLTPDLMIDALQVIHQSIDSGVPAIVWNLVSFEFGLIYGYDDDKCQFMYSSVCQTALAVPYSSLGRTTDNPELFVAALRKNTASKTMTPSAIALALETLLLHSKGEEKGVEGYTQGLEAYDKWIEAFRLGVVQSLDHAYNVTLLAEAREQATAFLRKLQLNELFLMDLSLRGLLEAATERFYEVNLLYLRLYPGFPFGMPGFQLDNGNEIIALLMRIKTAEKQGIDYLEQILREIT